MQFKVDEKHSVMHRLGPSRPSITEQRQYLDRIAKDFTLLVDAGVEGEYLNRDFSEFFADETKRLRDTITQTLECFADNIRSIGRTRSDNNERILADDFTREYCDKVATMTALGRGKALPGQIPPSVVTTIFRQQSVEWDPIAHDYLEICTEHVRDFITSAVMRVAGAHTGNQLLNHHIHPAFAKKTGLSTSKLQELLWPYQNSHPTTYNRGYLASIQHIRNVDGDEDDSQASDEDDSQVGDVDAPSQIRWTSEARERGLSNELLVAAEAIDRAEAYYKVCLLQHYDYTS